MALDRVKDANENKQQTSESFKGRPKRERSFQTKVIIRRLPPTMTDEQFLDQISPAPDNDYFHFVKGDLRLGIHSFSRAYMNFCIQEDVFVFKEKFDGYVFLDAKGNEYPAIVEFSPFQKIPKKRSKKRDAKCGTIETDADYLNFLENLKNPTASSLPTAEVYLEEIELREKELRANNGVPKIVTPLIQYVKQRKIEQQKIREEKREERKRKELEKKRIREEERRRRKAEKERKEKQQSQSEENAEESATLENAKTDPVVQVLKNPEREKDVVKEQVYQKPKDFYSRTERSTKDWHQNKDKSRSEKNYPARDKERGRRAEYRSTHSNTKFAQSDAKTTKVSKQTSPKVAKLEEEGGNREPNVEVIDKCVAKIKRDKSCPGNVETLIGDDVKDSNDHDQQTDDSKSEGCLDRKDELKDPRNDRRIRNKDRPSLEIYRPGMRRLVGTQRNSPQKETCTSTSNSSSPSPTPSNSSKVQPQDDQTANQDVDTKSPME